MCVYWISIGPSRFKVNSLLNFGGNCIYRNENQSINYKNICSKYAKKLIKSVMTDLPLLFIAHAIFFEVAIYTHYRQNIEITPLAINLPFLEKNSDLELFVNMIFQSIMGTYSAIGCFGLEIGECIMNNAIIAIPDVIRFNLSELDDECEANGMNLKSILQLRNTFRQIQDYQRYVVYREKLFKFMDFSM